MSDITMPQLSDSMEEGTILTWLKAPGENVELGDELVEIETDKATVTYNAEVAGVLEILVVEGTSVAVGDPIARLLATDPASGTSGAGPERSEPEARPTTSENALGSSAVAITAAAGAAVGANRANGADSEVPRRTAATPLARRAAAVHGVALDEIEGTGPLGRVTRSDVLSKAGLAAAPPAAGPGATRREPSRLQQVIARRMAEAKATIPHFQVQTEAVVDRAIALRADLKAVAQEHDPVPSLNDIIIKAAAIALREHPLANGSYTDGGFELHDAVNIGMAVAADEALVVPTVFDAVAKSLGQIARETRALAERVRNGEITPHELSGGTFTVSNLGMFGMTAITPVINPPQAAILGVGAMRDTLARVDGEIVDRTLLTLTLSCDHRILYGADAARFLARIRDLLETPLKLAF
jgi:pyruvate dehydrogenase E2 component (dihydrolipoamide acetyltransferase)